MHLSPINKISPIGFARAYSRWFWQWTWLKLVLSLLGRYLAIQLRYSQRTTHLRSLECHKQFSFWWLSLKQEAQKRIRALEACHQILWKQKYLKPVGHRARFYYSFGKSFDAWFSRLATIFEFIELYEKLFRLQAVFSTATPKLESTLPGYVDRVIHMHKLLNHSFYEFIYCLSTWPRRASHLVAFLHGPFIALYGRVKTKDWFHASKILALDLRSV